MKTKIIFACFIVFGLTFTSVFAQSNNTVTDTSQRHLNIKVTGIYDAKISITPYSSLKTISPVDVSIVMNNDVAKLSIPKKYLPNEFTVRFDYRTTSTDKPAQVEKNIFINDQDIEMQANPLFLKNIDSTKFEAGEKENTIFANFNKENLTKRNQIDLLRQFLLNYDQPKSKFYLQGVKEFEKRRLEYNKWLNDNALTYSNLFVSKLFQFQYIPSFSWSGTKEEQISRVLKNYFEGINFKDTLILRSSELSKMMNEYMGFYAMLITKAEIRDSLFTQAGSIACESTSKGAPKVYGWMVDYFYVGYESYNITMGMTMLQKHINNPNCLTSKKQQILKRLDSMTKLVEGAISPNFVLLDNDGNNFEFYKWKGTAKHKLLLFWSADCEHCQQLVSEIYPWYNKPENSEKLDVIAVSLDETETEVPKWKKAIIDLPKWNNLRAKGGINSTIANDYAVLSTPVMFLIDSETNIIKAVPTDLNKLIESLKKN